MYIDHLKMTNVRTFVRSELRFIHPDQDFRTRKNSSRKDECLLPKPKLPNVTLLLGDNGSGKTTVLQAIAIASLGPAAREAQLPLRKFVRFAKAGERKGPERAEVSADLRLHEQDGDAGKAVTSMLAFHSQGELERLEFNGKQESASLWERVYESRNDAFFCAAYGATRRVDTGDSANAVQSSKPQFLRAQRLQSIFQDSFALFPLAYWLPELQSTNPGRYKQVVQLLNRLLKPARYRFTSEVREREYLFEHGGMSVPFRSLSDGYRAFIAWVADLLYHVCYGCPSGKKLVESSGVVLVDEIDLHLHPRWQMQVVQTVAKALPRMQFVFTSHSPLIAGSLEWMNIITLRNGAGNRTISRRPQKSIHGLDADQILLTDLFGLKTTIAAAKRRQLESLTARIRSGDKDAPLQLLRAMSSGTEEDR